MPFQPGHQYTQGRPKGSRNKRTVELWNRLEARGDLDPADYLSTVVSNTDVEREYRIQAAGLLMPYKYSKCGTQPVLLFIEDTVRLPYPDPTILAHARKYLVHFPTQSLSANCR